MPIRGANDLDHDAAAGGSHKLGARHRFTSFTRCSMTNRLSKLLPLTGACVLAYLASIPADACCPAGPKGKPVVNADQTVVILWDAANKTQHFIRQASF